MQHQVGLKAVTGRQTNPQADLICERVPPGDKQNGERLRKCLKAAHGLYLSVNGVMTSLPLLPWYSYP